MAKNKQVDLFIDNGVGKIDPATVRIMIGGGDTYQTQVFNNRTEHQVTILFPYGLSPEGCIFGIDKGHHRAIKISACAPRNLDVPYWVFFADPEVRDWGVAASPPTMKIGP